MTVKATLTRRGASIVIEGEKDEVLDICDRLTAPPPPPDVPPARQWACTHDFPALWMGVIPPTCSRCGLQSKGATW